MEKKRLSMCFDAESYFKEAVETEFLRFLGRHSSYLFEWPTWMECFVDLYFGGRSSDMVPWWRLKQLEQLEKAMKKVEEKVVAV